MVWRVIRREARRTWVFGGGACLRAASCQVACDSGLRLLLSLRCISLLPLGYVPDFICRSDLRSEMGPAQPLWGLQDDSKLLLGPGPGHGVRDEPLTWEQPWVPLHPGKEGPQGSA